MQEPGHAHAGDRRVLRRQDAGSVGGQQGGHLGHRQRGRQPRQPQPEVRVRRHHGPEHRRGRRAAHVRRVAHVAPEARGGGALGDGAGEVAQGRREAWLGEGGVRGGGRGGHGDGGRGGGQDWGRMELSTSRARCSWLASLSGIWNRQELFCEDDISLHNTQICRQKSLENFRFNYLYSLISTLCFPLSQKSKVDLITTNP